jgi:hypothetical protein
MDSTECRWDEPSLLADLRQELTLLNEDPEGSYRRLPRSVAEELDAFRRASLELALARCEM